MSTHPHDPNATLDADNLPDEVAVSIRTGAEHLAPGDIVGNYMIEQRLAAGAFATVYRARHRLLDTSHALKIVLEPDTGSRLRLLTEARIQARLIHPNVIAIRDVFEYDGVTVLVADLVVGPTLADWLAQNRPDTETAERLFRQIVEGVRAAHGIGVIHRDLKPANILLEGEALTPKITDFGLARDTERLGITQSGTTLGTPAYMAPEQVRDGKHADERADVYALGCILYELVSGRRVFESADVATVLAAVTAGRYTPIEQVIDTPPPHLAAAIKRCIQLDPADRLPDCDALLGLIGSPATPDDGDEIAAGRSLGSYVLERRIGEGGMGEVWSATHTHLGRRAAIKVIRPELLGRRDAGNILERFKREARATSSLRSPHTVQLFDFGETETGLFYAAMELLDGCTLEELVEREGPRSADQVLEFLPQVCESLVEAHAVGLLHRDIKPANIFLCSDGNVKLLDFGLVTTAEDDADPGLTASATALGTPAYMPPEALKGRVSYDARSDLYAIGCVAHWLLTGKLLFEEDTAMGMAVAHLQDPAPSTTALALHPVPKGLDVLIRQCLDKDPTRRPQSAQILLTSLESLSSGADLPVVTPRPTRTPMMLFGVAAIVAPLLALLAWNLVPTAEVCEGSVAVADWVSSADGCGFTVGETAAGKVMRLARTCGGDDLGLFVPVDGQIGRVASLASAPCEAGQWARPLQADELSSVVDALASQVQQHVDAKHCEPAGEDLAEMERLGAVPAALVDAVGTCGQPEPEPVVEAPVVEKICFFEDSDTPLRAGVPCCERGQRAPHSVLAGLDCTKGYMCLRWGAECR